MKPSVFAALLVGAAAPLLAACGVDDGTVTSAAVEQPTVTPFAFESLLARIPDNETTRESVLITDIAAVRAFAGIEPPGPDADEEAVIEYISQVYLAGQNGPKTIIPHNEGWISGFHNYVPEFSTYPYLGIDARNVDQIAVYQRAPPITVEVVAGLYNRDASAKALDECVECPAPTVVEQGDAAFWAWGEDMKGRLADRLRPPAFDFVGRGGRIWIDDGLAVRTLRTADMQEVIDASVDKTASLADDEGYVLAARQLSELGVTSAIFSSASFSADDLFERLKPLTTADAFQTLEGTLQERLNEAPLMRAFELIAVGTAFDGTDPFTAVAIVHTSPAEASANAEILRQRIETSILPLNEPSVRKSDEPPKAVPRYWRDAISRHEVVSDGRVLVARLYGPSATSLVPSLVPSSVMGMGGIPMAPLTVHE